jgi:hypothetical protein
VPHTNKGKIFIFARRRGLLLPIHMAVPIDVALTAAGVRVDEEWPIIV